MDLLEKNKQVLGGITQLLTTSLQTNLGSVMIKYSEAGAHTNMGSVMIQYSEAGAQTNLGPVMIQYSEADAYIN